jgi:hypothetical protein
LAFVRVLVLILSVHSYPRMYSSIGFPEGQAKDSGPVVIPGATVSLVLPGYGTKGMPVSGIQSQSTPQPAHALRKNTALLPEDFMLLVAEQKTLSDVRSKSEAAAKYAQLLAAVHEALAARTQRLQHEMMSAHMDKGRFLLDSIGYAPMDLRRQAAPAEADKLLEELLLLEKGRLHHGLAFSVDGCAGWRLLSSASYIPPLITFHNTAQAKGCPDKRSCANAQCTPLLQRRAAAQARAAVCRFCWAVHDMWSCAAEHARRSERSGRTCLC